MSQEANLRLELAATRPTTERRRHSLVESSSINANHNPGVGEQHIWLLKVLDVFKSVNYEELECDQLDLIYLEFAMLDLAGKQ